MTVLIAGRPDDPPIAACLEALRSLGLPSVFADLSRPGTRVDGARVITSGCTLSHAGTTGVYLRSTGAHEPATAVALLDWAESAPGSTRVVNRWDGAATNLSKPLQSLHIARGGFRTPDTLLTTDPARARAFVQRHGRVIVKSTSAVRSIVRLVSPDEDLSKLVWCPTQFQAFVPGVEYRVHVVGERVFAHRIFSEAIDYRYGGGTLTPAALPSGVVRRCVDLSRRLGLELAGLDLRCSPEGHWYCFEVNTSPAWSCYDADGRIGRALARHLAGQENGRRRVGASGSRRTAPV